jgi:hypothetical protein
MVEGEEEESFMECPAERNKRALNNIWGKQKWSQQQQQQLQQQQQQQP